ncbi:STP2 Transcriptional regulator STP2 [Candida maltosa Xu316]
MSNRNVKHSTKEEPSFNLYNFIINVFEYLVSLFLSYSHSLLIVKGDETLEPTKRQTNNIEKPQNIFPTLKKSNFSTYQPEKPVHDDVLKPTVCSTGITSRILPYTNEKGELEWRFTELPGRELDAFKLEPNDHGAIRRLTPTSSSEDISKDESITPNSVGESPVSSETESTFTTTSSTNNNNGQLFKCPHCDAEFKVRGYLTRHLKKHSTKKAYTCPFHDRSIYIDDNNITHKCHPSGGFSRRDTYKTHLKSRHFSYEKLIKSTERSKVPGSCAMCGEQFTSAEIWCEIHVEGGECKFLPPGFKGKSRIKNRLRKQIQKNKSIDPELIPYANKVLEEVKQEQQQQEHQHQSPPPSQQQQQPQPAPVPIAAAHQQSMDTPASIYSSSSYDSASTHSPYTPQSSRSPMSQPFVAKQMAYFDQIGNAYGVEGSTSTKDDYDDEYCLDIDQLNSTFYNEMVGNYVHPQPQMY